MSFGTNGNENPYAAPATTSSLEPQSFFPGGNLATRGERLAGALIDGLIMIPIALGAGMGLGIVLVVLGIDPDGFAFQGLSSVLGGILGAVIFLAINGYLLATKGQTVGKLLLKMQIVSDRTNEILPFGPLVLKRYVPFWVLSSIPVVGGFANLADALAIFRENRKCIHDEIAGTKVIKLSR